MANLVHHHQICHLFSLSFIFFVLAPRLGLFVPVVDGKVPAIIVFGDSTVDTGNNNGIKTILKANFMPYGRDFEGGQPTGRFSNGRVPVDFFSEYFGLNKYVPAYLDPEYGMDDFVTGVNFASAGTGYDPLTSSVLNVIPFGKEMDYFKEYIGKLKEHVGEEKANEIITEAVYILSIGTNDWLENYYILPLTRAQFTVAAFQDHLLEIARKFMEELYSLGARKMTIAGLPPMGCLPLERTIHFTSLVRDCNEKYNRVALEYNIKLEGMVNQLNAQNPGIRVFYCDVYTTLDQMIANPGSFGMDEANKACCGTGLVEMSYLCQWDNSLACEDADKYVFWDSFHPTEKTNEVIAQHLFKTVLYKFLH